MNAYRESFYEREEKSKQKKKSRERRRKKLFRNVFTSESNYSNIDYIDENDFKEDTSR